MEVELSVVARPVGPASAAEEPLRERLWAYRMAAYRDRGRRSETLATYAAARTVLVEELGIEPEAALRRAFDADEVDDTDLLTR